MRTVAKKRNIIVVLWLAGSAGRKQLTGILRYVNEGHPWGVHLITEPKDFTDEIVRKATEDKVDGFLVHTDAISADALAVSNVPTVLMDFPTPALRLRTTQLSIKTISHLCGYANEQRLKYVFKARIGCSMSEWRHQFSASTSKSLRESARIASQSSVWPAR